MDIANIFQDLRTDYLYKVYSTVSELTAEKADLYPGCVVMVLETMGMYKVTPKSEVNLIDAYSINVDQGITVKRKSDDTLTLTSNFDNKIVSFNNLFYVASIDITKNTNIARDKFSISLYSDVNDSYYTFNPHAFNVKYMDDNKREVMSTSMLLDENNNFKNYGPSYKYNFEGLNLKQGDTISFNYHDGLWTCSSGDNNITVKPTDFIMNRSITTDELKPTFKLVMNTGESFDVKIGENFGGTSNIDLGNNIAIYTSLNLPYANTAKYGIVKIGTNISVNSTGVISIPNASTSGRGVVRIGSNLSIDGNGLLSVPKASKTTYGVVQAGSTLTFDSTGKLEVDTSKIATSSGLREHIDTLTSKEKWGHAKVGDNINVTNGIISVPPATSGVFGVVKTGGNIVNTNGTISVNTASKSVKGLVQVGNYLTVNSAGLIDIDKTKLLNDTGLTAHMSRVATSTVLGHVKIGANISVTSDGTISTHAPYVHPSTHPASMISQDSTHRFISDSERSSWNDRLPMSGGTMRGGITFSTDSTLTWSRNTDAFTLGFKNTSDSDGDSYGYFKISDNGNEYFKFLQVNGATTTELVSIKSDAIRFKGNVVYHTGNFNANGIVYNNGTYDTLTLRNWIRVTGNAGLYNATYDGRIYMQDRTWWRFDKAIITPSTVNCNRVETKSFWLNGYEISIQG